MILIGFGSNQPFLMRDNRAVLECAVEAVSQLVELTAISRVYRSPAWPDARHPDFVNAVVSAISDETPQALLAGLHAIEAGFGRRRTVKNAPRTLDLDLLAYGDMIIEPEEGENGLRLPHPAIAARDFVLAPLCDIAPDWRHPVTGVSAAAMLAALPSSSAKPLPGRVA